MAVNILLDPVPEEVEIGGTMYRINSDYRVSVLFELMMSDDELDARDKIALALDLYYGCVPDDIGQAVEKLLWFYRCGDEVKKKQEKRFDEKTGKFVPVDNSKTSDLVYSFEHDAQYIYAAFMEQYGIDLTEEDMHWWKFRALFRSLNESTKFVKIMGYRSIEISPSMSKQQRMFYENMKELYALPVSQKEQDRQDAIVAALMGDGDVSGLL